MTSSSSDQPGLPSQAGSPRGWLALGLILLLSLAFRGAYLAERRAQPDFEQPVVDAGYHDYWARQMAGLEAEVPAGKADPAIDQHPCLRPPLYPWMLSWVYGLSSGSFLAPRVVQHALGLLAVCLVWLLARRGLGIFGAGLAALFFGIHWAPVYFEGELHAPALLIPLLLLMALCALQALASRPGTGRLAWAAACGLTGGLAALARPNALFPLGALALCLLWRWKRGAQGASQRGWAPALVPVLALSAGAALGIAPGTARNLAASGEPVLITSAGGINLYLGNRAGAGAFLSDDLSELGLGRFRTCFDYPAIVKGLGQAGEPELSHSEVDRFFRDKALEAIAAEPGAFVTRTLQKTLLFLGPAEVGHNKEVALERARSQVLRWSPTGWFPLLLALALLGFSRLPGEPRGSARRDLLVVSGLICVAWGLSVIPFFAAARYRVPIVPLLCVAAGGGLLELLRPQLRGPRFGLRAGLALGVSLALSLAAAPLAPAPSETKWHLDRGRGLFDGGDLAGAREAFEAAIELEPQQAAAHFELAITDHKDGDLEAAAAGYGRVLALRPGHAKAAFNLGYLEEQAGRGARAVRLYLEALGEEPELEAAQAGLGRVAQGLAAHPRAAQRDGALAQRAAERLLELRGAQDPGGLFVLAAAQAEQGQFAQAQASLQRLRAVPGLPPQMGPALENAQRLYAAGQPLRIPR